MEKKFDKLVKIYKAWYAVMVLSGTALVVAGMTQAGACWWMVPAGIFVGVIGVSVVNGLFENYLNELMMISNGSKVEA